jgi:hypothetical protein
MTCCYHSLVVVVVVVAAAAAVDDDGGGGDDADAVGSCVGFVDGIVDNLVRGVVCVDDIRSVVAMWNQTVAHLILSWSR